MNGYGSLWGVLERSRRTLMMPWAAGMLAGATLAMAPMAASHAQFLAYHQWIDPDGGSYAASSNWSPAGVPDTDFEGAFFNLNNTYTIAASASYTVGSLDVSQGNVQLNIDPSRTYTTSGLRIEAPAGGEASLTIGSTGGMIVQGIATVGSIGHDTLTVANVNGLSTGVAILGANPGATGVVNVNHLRGWSSVGPAIIGQAGDGELNQIGLGNIITASAVLGEQPTGRGTATISGDWYSGDLIVGDRGYGEVALVRSVQLPGSNFYTGNLYSDTSIIAAQPGSIGRVRVIGDWLDDSHWGNTGSVYVGGTSSSPGGDGRLEIGRANSVSVDGDLRIWSGGTLALHRGGVFNVDGAASLGGALEFMNELAAPQLGNEFQVGCNCVHS